jgi:AcrR family transcriptional regulator
MEPDQRRAAILRAARDQFGQRPYSGVSVADVARAAGVSPPLVVFYFGSKRALYLEVVETAARTIRQGLRDVPGPPSLERLAAAVRCYAGYAYTRRAGFLSLLHGGQAAELPEAAAIVEELRADVTAQILRDLEADDDSRNRDQTTMTLAVRGYLGYLDAVIVYWLTLPEERRGSVTPDTIAALAVGAFTGGLNAV